MIGFLRLEFEGNVLYLHREDYDNAILGDGIWVDETSEMNKQRAKLNMSYVLLEGIFSSRERGHMGMWSGTIKEVRRAPSVGTREARKMMINGPAAISTRRQRPD